MKKLFTTMMLLAVSLPLLAYDFVYDGIYYNIIDETAKTVEVTYYDYNNNIYVGDIDIPSSTKYFNASYSVTSIGANAFRNSSGLTSVTIPSCIASIGQNAFSNCSALTSIVVDEGNSVYDSRKSCNAIIKIATNTLIAGCKNTVIPNSVTAIGDDAFLGCTGLTVITIPNSVTTIGNYAFSGCSNLQVVSIGNSVSSIGNNAFEKCSEICIINSHNTTPPDSAPFENGVKNSAILSVPSLSIYGNATGWKDFKNMRELALEGNYDFEVDGFYYRIVSLSDKTIEVVAKDDYYNSYKGDVVIPQTVNFRNNDYTVITIGDAAFLFCNDLRSVTISQSVEKINQMAFYRCTGLTEVTIGNNVSTIGDDAFNGCTSLTAIVIPGNVTSIGNGAFNGCTALKSLTIADSDVTLDAGSTFSNSSIETLYLGRNYNGKFSDSYSLHNVEISNNVDNLSSSMFKNCSISKLKLPDSLKRILKHALANTKIRELVIPGSVTLISEDAFEGCIITKLFIENSKSGLNGDSFRDLPLTDLYLDREISYTFENHHKLESVIIGGNVKSLNENTFNNCGIKNLIIESGDQELALNCKFTNCHISKLHLDRNLSNSQANFNELIDVTIGNNVTKIPSSIFSNSPNIKSLRIGNKVKLIEASFESSIEPMNVYSFNTTPLQMTNAFANKTYMQGTLYLPKGCTDAYMAADVWKDFWTITEEMPIEKNGLTFNRLDDNTLTLTSNVKGEPYSGQIVIPATVEVDGKVYNVSSIESDALETAYNVTSVIIEDSKESLKIDENEHEILDIFYNKYSVIFSDCTIDSVYVGRDIDYQIEEFEFDPEWTVYYEGQYTHVYIWDAGESNKQYCGAWPGTAMEVVDGNLKKITINITYPFVDPYIIFNDGGVNHGQTQDLELYNNGLYVNSGVWEYDYGDTEYSPQYVYNNNSPFTNNTYISKVAIGPDVTSMGGAMFAGCANIEKVYALGSTPALEAEFESFVYDNATLIVPNGAYNDYSTADAWKEFINIVEVKDAKVEDALTDDCRDYPTVTTVNGKIVVLDNADAQIAVYNINGILIYRGINRPVDVLGKGIYVVVVDGTAVKVIV